ncbi:TIGR04283 family arsenosugar biosynthesis glycosyltransferase [Allosphingosinicella humi]
MLSVVIPTLNGGAHLGACLDALAGEADEVIIVDGGSSDDSIAIAEAAGAHVIRTARGRGVQLRAGGEAARGEWLLFLHSDTHLGPGWRERVAAHVGAGSGQAACFRFRLDDAAWQARVVEWAVALRVGLIGLPYGDQGLLVSRALYERVGGFRPLVLMEDVDLVKRLGRIRTLDADAVTSAERWRRDGWFLRSAKNLFCLALYRRGVSPETIARLYS